MTGPEIDAHGALTAPSSELSRRTVLGGAAALAVGVGAVATGGITKDSSAALLHDVHAETIVAHVLDARSGVIELLVGDRQLTVVDTDLAARLANASHPLTTRLG